MARRQVTVLEVCIGRAGVLRGGRVQAFIACWTIASANLGRPITLDDYMDWWKVNRRTAYREQEQFRKVFKAEGLATPQPFADAAIAQGDELVSGGVGRLGSLPAGPVLA